LWYIYTVLTASGILKVSIVNVVLILDFWPEVIWKFQTPAILPSAGN